MGKRLTYEFVKEQFEKEGYELLSKEYLNSQTKLRYRCPKGHEHSIKWGHFRNGCRCPYCAVRSSIDIEFVRSEFAKEGYKLLAKEYRNNKQKLEYVCSKGHKGAINWNNWRTGKRCSVCSRKKESAKKRTSLEFIRQKFGKEGYNLLTKNYKNNLQKLSYICPKGHKYNIIWNSWQQGHRCPYCFGSISKSEIEVRGFVESLGIKVLPNNRNQIFNPQTEKGLELDIFMPSLNKAIEYNGEYWHQDKNRDLLKQKLCESKSIALLIVWHKEWKTEKDVCKDEIKEFVLNEEII